MDLDLSWLQLVRLPPLRYDEDGEETDDPNGIEAPPPPFLSDASRLIKLAGVKVGYIECYVLRKDEMLDQFHRALDSTTQEILEFGRTLFDYRGRLRSQFGPSGSKGGTGCWGTELSTGSLAFISEINIKADLRSQGVGKAALHLLTSALAHPEKEDTWSSCKGAFLIPAILLDTEPENMDDEREEEEYWSDHDSDVSSMEELELKKRPLPPTVVANRERNLQRVNSFFLDCGFRRVGTTPYLGFSFDEHHPSRQLDKASDRPLRRRPGGESLNPQKHYPLHFHIATATSTLGPDLLPLISYIRTAPLEYIQRADHLGWTPLHTAASLFNLPVCKALVARSRTELQATTWDGLAPMDVLKDVISQAEDYRRAMREGEEEVEDEMEEEMWAWLLKECRSV